MEYFIHPIWFYVVDLMDTLNLLPLIIILVGGVFLLVAVIFKNPVSADEVKAFYKYFVKPVIIIFIIGSIISVLAPSSSTCYKMMAASIVTPDNVEIAKDGVVEFIGDIAEIFEDNAENE